MKKDTIFVSIASYRDDVCNSTLKSLFSNAKYPKNVYVGICQQNKEDEDEDCIKDYENNPNVKIMRISHKEAKGPTYARYFCSTLWNDEEYFMQVDSHTNFVKDWDVKCINMIKQIKNEGLSTKPVLSHYPKEIGDSKNYDANDVVKRQSVPRICQSFFNSRDMLSFMGAEIMDTKNTFYKTPYMAAGMIFCEAKFLRELPYDPELPYLFVGEEILHSIRFYTHGWDIFTPNENVIFHEYTRKNKPKIWTDNPYYSDMAAFQKVKYYLGMDKEKSKITEELKKNLSKYGLGNERTLEDYYNFAGINIKDKKIIKNFCRKNDIGNEKDILNSNEKNHKKAENFKFPDTPPRSLEITLFIILSILIIVSVYVYIAKNKTKK